VRENELKRNVSCGLLLVLVVLIEITIIHGFIVKK